MGAVLISDRVAEQTAQLLWPQSSTGNDKDTVYAFILTGICRKTMHTVSQVTHLYPAEV